MMNKKIIKLIKLFCRHGIAFTTKEKAQILKEEKDKRSTWTQTKIKKCLFCKKYYVKNFWSTAAKKIRKEIF